MIEIKGKKYKPNFTLGAMEEFEALTGIDVFNCMEFKTVSDKIAFVKCFTGCDETLSDMHPTKFSAIFISVLMAYNKAHKNEGEDTKKKEAQ